MTAHRFTSTDAFRAHMSARMETSDPKAALHAALDREVLPVASATLADRIDGMMIGDVLDAIMLNACATAFSLSATALTNCAAVGVVTPAKAKRLMEQFGETFARTIKRNWPNRIQEMEAIMRASRREPTVSMTCGPAGTHPSEAKS